MIPPALASFRLATCEFMVDIEATPGTTSLLTITGFPQHRDSRNAIVKSQRPCLRHVPPEKGNFPARFRAPLRSSNGHDQASKISSALAVSICSEKRE